jgi:phosphoglucomutase
MSVEYSREKEFSGEDIVSFPSINVAEEEEKELLKEYQAKYESFVTAYSKNAKDARDVGLKYGELAGYCGRYLTLLNDAEFAYNKKLKEFENGKDEITEKPFSSAKANSMAMASDEWRNYIELKRHVENIDRLLSACKQMQFNAMKDWQNSKNSYSYGEQE